MAKKATAKKFDDTISLPTKEVEMSDSLFDYNSFFYGDKGIGKSTLALQHEDVVAHFLTEFGRSLKGPVLPKKGEAPLTWDRFKDYVDKIIEKHSQGRVVIDTIDRLCLLCEQHHAARLKVDSIMSIEDHGRTWNVVITDFENTMNALVFSGLKLTLTSHVRVRPRLARGVPRSEMAKAIKEGLVTNQIQPTTRGWGFDWSKIPIDIVGNYTYWGDSRVLHVRGSETRYAAVGPEGHFLQPKGTTKENDSGKKVSIAGKPYTTIFMGESSTEAYTNYVNAWNNKVEGWYFDNDELPTYLSEQEE